MLSLVIALALPAQAQDYAIQWPAGESRYHVETLVAFPRGFTFYATRNTEGRVLQFGLVADLACTSSPHDRGAEVVCELDEVLMEGQPMKGDEEQVPVVMTEYATLLSEARVELEIAEDGRIRKFDLEGFPKGTQRENDIHETLRQVLRRSLSPLDVMAPRDGKDPGKSWKHRGQPMGFELLTKTGTAGGVLLRYETEGEVAGRKVFVGGGRANVSTNAEADQGGQGAVNLNGYTRTLLDPATHQVAYSEVVVEGILSARAAAGAVSQDTHYRLATWIGRVNADGTIETVEGPAPRGS